MCGSGAVLEPSSSTAALGPPGSGAALEPSEFGAALQTLVLMHPWDKLGSGAALENGLV